MQPIIYMSHNYPFIKLDHGSGGTFSHELVEGLFRQRFSFAPDLAMSTDASPLNLNGQKLRITTDSFVVDPLFFTGGNIGTLAICGTINDLAVSGAIPKALTCGFILEEGFPLADLELIVDTMAELSKRIGVPIIAGDTKVVDRGKVDRCFINTTGIGLEREDSGHVSQGDQVIEGDVVILSGPMGDHGMTIMAARHDLDLEHQLSSDCAPLSTMISAVLNEHAGNVRFMRDATRGGVATVCCEWVENRSLGIELIEDSLPVRETVRGLCEILGIDPLYVANEGRIVIIAAEKVAQNILSILHSFPEGEGASIIGKIQKTNPRRVILRTAFGGSRFLSMLSGAQLPRIC